MTPLRQGTGRRLDSDATELVLRGPEWAAGTR
jgi:hypothetical protein